jgi:hypothetical protein
MKKLALAFVLVASILAASVAPASAALNCEVHEGTVASFPDSHYRIVVCTGASVEPKELTPEEAETILRAVQATVQALLADLVGGLAGFAR